MFSRIKLAIAKIKWLIVAALVVVGVSVSMVMSQVAYSQPPSFTCTPSQNRIDWPTGSANPTWSLCWKPPADSSGIAGSGLELTNVYYKGKKVLHQAGVPVLNVLYDPGGCGNSERTYRDWQNEVQPFEFSSPADPVTVCNHPGTDRGTFQPVAVQKLSNKLVLTTQMRAGWYRYIMKWSFYPNGNIEPRFGFTAVTNYCTTKPHTHHAYWRWDFDINGSSDDRIDVYNNGTWSTLNVEANAIRNNTGKKWRVMDHATNRGFEVVPQQIDGIADSFAVADVWALRYKNTEIDDGGPRSPSPRDAAKMNAFINNESINRQDVVFWYRAGNRHAGGIGCTFAGPTLKAVGSW